LTRRGSTIGAPSATVLQLKHHLHGIWPKCTTIFVLGECVLACAGSGHGHHSTLSLELEHRLPVTTCPAVSAGAHWPCQSLGCVLGCASTPGWRQLLWLATTGSVHKGLCQSIWMCAPWRVAACSMPCSSIAAPASGTYIQCKQHSLG